MQALPQFLQTLTTLEDIPLHSGCKVLSAVSALVQALPSETDKIEPLQKMLQLIRNLEVRHTAGPPLTQGNETHTSGPQTQDDETYSPLYERLSMLAAVARGLQGAAEIPIDLEATKNTGTTFWTDGAGRQTQQLVLQMLAEPWSRLLESNQADLVSAACELLKAGFKEDHPTPFKFPLHISTELLCTLINIQNANLDQTMNTASCYVSSEPVPTPETSPQAETLISRVLAITKEATKLLTDPATSTTFSAPTCILDFVIRSLPKYGIQILTHTSAIDMMSTFTDYAILLLQSTTDTLPRRSAAAFFTSFLEYTDPASTLMSNPNPAVATNINALLSSYSPTVLALTLHLLSGECARSEIDSLTLLLRTYISKQPLRAKPILATAIRPENGVLTPTALSATKPEQRARFIAQVESLRGARKTNDVVRDFWVACRGGQFGYVT